MDSKNYKVVLLLIFMLLGVALAFQFKSTLSSNKQKLSLTYETNQLKTLLEEEKKHGEQLKAAIKSEEKIWEDNLKSTVISSDNTYLKTLLSDLETARLKAGLTDVKGPGIILKLDDALAKKNYDLTLLLIHDSDIKKLLNEMRLAGAQAISINDERIVSTSEPICAGPTILINKNKYPVPYTIKAIGNPDALYKAVDESQRMTYMRRDGIRVNLEKSKEIIIYKYGNNDIEKLRDNLEVLKK